VVELLNVPALTLISSVQRACPVAVTGEQANCVPGNPVAFSPGKPVAFSPGNPVAFSPGVAVEAALDERDDADGDDPVVGWDGMTFVPQPANANTITKVGNRCASAT
jgi:hypothetical protein